MTPILRGQVWWVEFDPQAGMEVKFRHPAVVVSDDAGGLLPLKIVVPITGAENIRRPRSWHIPLQPAAGNGLLKPSLADTFQVKSLDTLRFVGLVGTLSADDLNAVLEGILLCLGVSV